MPLFHHQYGRLMQSGDLTYKQRVVRRLTMAKAELENKYCSISEAEKSLRGAGEVLREWMESEENG